MLDQIDENNKEFSLNSFALRQGLFLGLFLVIYQIITQFLDIALNPNVGYISYLVIIGTLVWSMLEFRKENDGYMSYSQGLGLGTILSAVGAAISSGFSIFYMTVIDPGFKDRMLNMMRTRMEEQNPPVPDEQIDLIIKTTEWMFHPLPLFFMGVIFFVIFGFFLSLIISIFISKSKPNPF